MRELASLSSAPLRRAACATVVAAFVMVGCGGGADGDDDTTSSGGTGASSGAATGGTGAAGTTGTGVGGTAGKPGGTGGSGGVTSAGGSGNTSGSSGTGTGQGGTAAGTGSGGAGMAGAGAPSVGGAAGTSSPSGGAGAGGSAGMSSGGSGTAGSGHAGSGAAGSAGTGGGTQLCDFASGLNVAWVNFANDVPNPDLNTFKTIFKNTHDAGGRVVRWWFHTNGTKTPGYDSSGMTVPLPQSHIDGVKAILGAAHDAGVVVDLSLWSFDMLQDNAGDAHTNNQKLLENDANRQAYVDNYLTPLVNAIKGTPGLYAWEIFNEPEGMGPNGWATYRTTLAAIQKTVNWFAAAIHTADPSALVTNGAVTFDYCSNASGKMNYYSDSALRAAGGKMNGTLDFYEVHYYTSNGSSNSCFMNPASHWGLDKMLVMGEFAAADTESVAQNDLYTKLYDTGYDGAWAWSYNADWKWPAMQAPMQALYTAHPDVGMCP